jgi:PLP dependent protein
VVKGLIRACFENALRVPALAMTRKPTQKQAMHSGLASIRQRIGDAARRAGRDPAAIELVVVSKTFGAEAITPVIEAGQRVFGENRVQEAKAKWQALMQDGIKLHGIGPLQTNKAAEAVALFDAIHTIDRIKLARLVAAEMAKQGRKPDLFIQVNTGEEPQKAGIAPGNADAFIGECRDGLGLAIAGLMCIPPADEDPARHFGLLATIARRNGIASLSMGMSGDFETAIAHGATHVRVGSAVFGHRG